MNYEKYCDDCKKNICKKCEQEHKEHNLQIIKEIIPDKNELKKNGEALKSQVNQTKENITDVFSKLNKAIVNIDKFYAIHNEILDGYTDDNINYEAAQNLAEINNNIQNEIYQLNEMDNGYNINNILNSIYPLSRNVFIN